MVITCSWNTGTPTVQIAILAAGFTRSDKSGHLLLQELGADGTKPDLLVHRPGYMEGNFATRISKLA